MDQFTIGLGKFILHPMQISEITSLRYLDITYLKPIKLEMFA